MKYLELSYVQVALAALLILVNGIVSLLLNLRLERMMLWASLRTVVQLLLIGFILEWVFEVERWYVVLTLLALMTVIAGVTATQRSSRRYPGIWLNTLLSVWASSWLVGSYGVFVVLQDLDRWYQPQYVIPLLGMILGNTLNGISLGLSTFTDRLLLQRDEVESKLAWGATRWEAALPAIQHSLRVGLIPIINSMLIVGLVSLPGMMTGQLLAGTSPLEAVKYQIVIMFLIASATAIGTTGVILLSFRRLFSADHQLLHHDIRSR